MPTPQRRLDVVADRTRLARLLAASAAFVGIGTALLANAATYGPAGSGPGAAGPPTIATPLFLGLLTAHAAMYLLSARLPRAALATLPYLGAQLAVAFALTLAAQRAFPSLFFFVLVATQAVSLYPRRWPLIVVGTGWAWWIAMNGVTTRLDQGVGGMVVLAMSVMAIYAVSFVRDTIARRQAAELLAELGEARSELGGYAEAVEQAALTSERQRMARELHDTLAQGLVGVALQLEAAGAYLGTDRPSEATAIVRQALARARETLGEARHAIEGLRADEPDESVGALLQREARRFSAATGIPCALAVDAADSIPPEVGEQLRRVIAEALTNVARHARASAVEATVTSRNGAVVATVQDDGVGFDTTQAPEPGHYGLLGLEERARALGGALAVESAPGSGATIRFSVPVPR